MTWCVPGDESGAGGMHGQHGFTGTTPHVAPELVVVEQRQHDQVVDGLVPAPDRASWLHIA